MRYEFKGKNMTIAEGTKERTQAKMAKLEKLLPDDSDVYVTFSENKHLIKMEVSIPMHKQRILRAEVTNEDVTACIDEAVNILESQVKKYKARLHERRRKAIATKEELKFISFYDNDPIVDVKEAMAPEIVITRTKRFALKPMEATEAAMEMELLNHNFYVFRNSWTDEINVVYRRHDGQYGLIEPH